MNNTNTLGKFRIISVRADGKVEQEQTLDFRNQRGDQPIRMQTAKGLKYRLVDVSKQGDAGPDEIQVRRVGKDLHIALDDGGQTDVVLENYYDNATQSQDGLYGLTQDGENYSYVPQDPQEKGLIDLLPNDGEWVEAALGSYQVSGAGAAVAVLAFNPLLAAAGAGVAAAAAGGGGGGNGGNGPSTVPATPSAAPTSYKDDIGTVQNAASTATVTDDNKPGINVPSGLTNTVNLYIDGVKVTSTYDSATGTLTPTAAVADGSHAFTYTLSDAAGNESGRSPALTFTIDTAAPTVPAAVVATDDVGANRGNIANNGFTDNTKPTFSGTGTAGDLIKVYDGNTVMGSVTVAAGGTWSFTPATPLTEGLHSITSTATDAAGNESPKSTALSFTAKNVLSISIPEALDGVNASEAANGVQVSINLPDVVFINDSVTLLVTRPDKSTYELGKKVTELNFQTKRMEFTVPDKQEGQYSLKATISGSSVEKSSAIENFTIDTTPTSNATVALGVNVGSDANKDGWVNASEVGSASTFTSRATFNANALVGDKIVFTAKNNDVELASQTVTLTTDDIANKYVSVSFAKPAEGMVQAVSANYMDAAGNAASDDSPVASAALDTLAPGVATIHGVILSSQYSSANVPMYVDVPIHAKVGDTITVTMTNTVISTEEKSTPFTTTLTVSENDLLVKTISFWVPGTHFSKSAVTEFSADSMDAAGNQSEKGYAVPAAPTVDAAMVDDDLSAFDTQAQITPNATRAQYSKKYDEYDYATIDKTLEFQGNANANDTVYLYENGVQIGVASHLGVSDQGIQAWGFSGTFAVGDHAITAKSVNAAGVVSDQSVVFTFSIQEELDIPDRSLLTGSSYSVANATPERLTLLAQDVLDLGRPLTVGGDVSDTLVLKGMSDTLVVKGEATSDDIANFDFVLEKFSEAQQGATNKYIQHIEGTNGQAGSWQFDLDGSGTMDLVVSDTIHRIILSA